MISLRCILLTVVCLASTTLASTGIAAFGAEPKGSLVIVGGGLRFTDAEVWSQIVELAGGRGATIAVFPTASGNPLKVGNRIVEAFKRVGADAFLVPVATHGTDVDYKQAVVDPKLVARVQAAGGVFFTGGEQERITRCLRTTEGKNTPMLDAVWSVYRRGGVVAGTSAGAAIMSRIMCRDAEFVLPTLQNGVRLGKEIDQGLGFMDPAWFVEQHCLTRGRFARALVVMHSQGFKYGIGVDDNTALVIRNGTDLKVIGYKGAVVLDLSHATHDPTLQGFNLKNVKLTYLDRGDSFNLATLAVKPSPEKEGDTTLDPNSADFSPHYDRHLVFNDILGNTAVADLLSKLINNKKTEAIGLAFDGLFGSNRPSQGFEFRFYREKDSIGWCTGAFGGEDFTVANIHLDISPVEIVGPVYKAQQPAKPKPTAELAQQPAKPTAELAKQPAKAKPPIQDNAQAAATR
jgi:cyanophycinase